MWKDCPRVYEPEISVTLTKTQFYEAMRRHLYEELSARHITTLLRDIQLEVFASALGRFAHEIGLHKKPEILS